MKKDKNDKTEVEEISSIDDKETSSVDDKETKEDNKEAKEDNKETKEDNKETKKDNKETKKDNKDNKEANKDKEECDKSKEYLEKYQRLMADFENYRKRNDKEKLEIYDRAVSNTAKELLTVIDNFERALKQECADKAFYDGVSMIYKQLFSALEKLGVEPIDAVGKEFDPNLHNAIFHVDDDQYGKNQVIEEMQKGYMFKEKVIRHSLVKVAN